MGFRLEPKSMTLNDHERRNGRGRYFAKFGSFWDLLCKVVQDTPIRSEKEM